MGFKEDLFDFISSRNPCELLHAFPFNAMLTVACHTPDDEKPRTAPKNQNSSVPSALRLGKSLADAGTTLARAKVLTADNGIGLLDNLLSLGQDELDVAGVRHVRVDL